jgi:signal transduction histidine kinase
MTQQDPKKILTIEDEERVRRSITVYFEDAGFEVLEAATGEDGIRLFNEEKPDVALVDLRMPGLNGVEVIKTLHEQCGQVPLIIVSGAGGLQDAIEAIRNGAWDYVTKPIRDMAALEHVVNQALERARLIKDNSEYQERLEELVAQKTEELRTTNRNLRELNKRLRSLVDTIHELHTCDDVKSYCKILLQKFAEHINASGGSLYLRNDQEFRLVRALDPGHAPDSLKLPLEENTVYEKVFSRKQPFLIQNIHKEEFSPSPYNQYPDDSAMAFPLTDENKDVIGLLSLHRKNSPPFTKQDLEVGSILASYSSEVLHATRSEQARRESEERLNLALQGADLVAWDFNLQLESQAPDEQWKNIALEPFGEDAGAMDESCFNQEDYRRATEELKRHLNGHTSVFEVEYRIRSSKNSTKWKWFLCKGKVLSRDDKGTPIRMAGTSLDITVRKETEYERQRMHEQMQHTQKLESLGVLAGGIAHDFNNLLVGILGNVDLAMSEIEEESNIRDYLEAIEQTSRRATDLCKQMLAYSGKGRFIVEPVDVNNLLHEMTRMLEVSISKKATLRYELAGELPPIQADSTQLRQVIMNLLTNASEALPDESGTISLSTYVRDYSREELENSVFCDDATPGSYVCIQVSDNGCGMNQETQDKLFEPFFTTKFTGRGLGMAAVLGIVRAHSGAVRLRSKPGKGSTFQILFPAMEKGTAVKKKSNASSDMTDSEPPNTMTVLLVDDEEHVRIIGRKMLEKYNHSVYTAKNGKEALEIFESRQDEIDCVVLDLTMPHMSGEEVIEKIYQQSPETPVVISSGYNEQELQTRFDDAIKPKGFIQKPYKAVELNKTLMEATSE